ERRAEDSADVIARRLRNAAEEIPHWGEYDYVLVNHDLERCLAHLRAILTAERLKRNARPQMVRFVAALMDDLARVAR
ncbi:MAG: guanylate kinase, partial [Proteobacteria bacterium]|nr:guanylate kinase [Pseudomonadota bacterium]